MVDIAADKRRLLILSGSYAALVGIAVFASQSLNVHLGALAVIPLLFISYYTRFYLALATALCSGIVLSILDQESALHAHLTVPPIVDAVILSASLCTVVVIASRLREQSITNEVLRGRLIKTRRAAERDVLTGIPNRAYFMQRLSQVIENESPAAILFCDLDGFKDVNDVYGHPVGDSVLTLAAGRLVNAVRADDFVARLGGDEFGIIVTRITTAEEASHMAENIERAFSDPFQLERQRFMVGITIGVSMFPDDGQSIDALMRIADARMYRAKQAKSAARTQVRKSGL